MNELADSIFELSDEEILAEEAESQFKLSADSVLNEQGVSLGDVKREAEYVRSVLRRAQKLKHEPMASGMFLSQEAFREVIALERKRSERSQKPFLLLLVDCKTTRLHEEHKKDLLDVLAVLSSTIRETDAVGWYAEGVVVGVMFTEIVTDQGSIVPIIMKRVSESLSRSLGLARFNQSRLSFHLFPGDWNHSSPPPMRDPKSHPDLVQGQRLETKHVPTVFGIANRSIPLTTQGASNTADFTKRYSSLSASMEGHQRAELETAQRQADDNRRAIPASRFLSQESFHKLIALERKRSERSRMPFVLVLVDCGVPHPDEHNDTALRDAVASVSDSIRETDAVGWYADGLVAGVMFTEIAAPDQGSIVASMMTRVSESLNRSLGLARFNQSRLSFHVFPEDWSHAAADLPSSPTLYPDLASKKNLTIKRAMDIVGSGLAVITLSPVFLLIALVIKLTSIGPVFFRQTRVGQFGKCFTFLKFRSMYVNIDSGEHKKYVQELIAGIAAQSTSGPGVFKLINDRRVTPFGGFLRRTSLDELPQLFNVLLGDMSLVGPRPPIPYEVEAYDIWHRRRVLEAKPGITGLWQVNGRNRMKFDDMVRLDLQYARNWTPWMDLWILLRTPAAVVLGEGVH